MFRSAEMFAKTVMSTSMSELVSELSDPRKFETVVRGSRLMETSCTRPECVELLLRKAKNPNILVDFVTFSIWYPGMPKYAYTFRSQFDMSYNDWIVLLRDLACMEYDAILTANFNELFEILCSDKHTDVDIVMLPESLKKYMSPAHLSIAGEKNINFSVHPDDDYPPNQRKFSANLSDFETADEFIEFSKNHCIEHLTFSPSLIENLDTSKVEKLLQYVANSVEILEGAWPPQAVRLFTKVKVMYICDTPLRICPASVEELYLRNSHLMIGDHDESLEHLRNLKFLSLENTYCEKFPPNLTTLHVSNVSIPDYALQILRDLKSLYLHDVKFYGNYPVDIEHIYLSDNIAPPTKDRYRQLKSTSIHLANRKSPFVFDEMGNAKFYGVTWETSRWSLRDCRCARLSSPNDGILTVLA